MTIAWRAGERGATRLHFNLPDGAEVSANVEQLLLTGYSGRDEADIAAHVAEMASLGVAGPDTVPVFHPAMSCLLTQGGTVQAIGPESRPEIEFVLFEANGVRFVTLGNDQFDLATEKHYSAVKSKSLCQKLVARSAWPLKQVSGHWDELLLELRSGATLLQSSAVSAILAPERLMADAVRQRGFRRERGMLFSGTVPMLRPVEAGMREFSMALRDPVLGRAIRCDFQVEDITKLPLFEG
jgi:hypothetical protein